MVVFGIVGKLFQGHMELALMAVSTSVRSTEDGSKPTASVDR